MSDIGTWQVTNEPYNRAQAPDGGWIIYGWPKHADPETAPPSTAVVVETGGRALADLIVASLRSTSKVVENVLAEQGKEAHRGLDPRGWRYAPSCATCKGTGVVNAPGLPGVSGHCECQIGRRMLDLHMWERACDNAEHDAWLQAKHDHGMEHPDDPYQPDPDEGPF